MNNFKKENLEGNVSSWISLKNSSGMSIYATHASGEDKIVIYSRTKEQTARDDFSMENFYGTESEFLGYMAEEGFF